MVGQKSSEGALIVIEEPHAPALSILILVEKISSPLTRGRVKVGVGRGNNEAPRRKQRGIQVMVFIKRAFLPVLPHGAFYHVFVNNMMLPKLWATDYFSPISRNR